MSSATSVRSSLGAGLADGVLVILLAIVGFLLCCHELFDPDVWWHLRGGQWIRSHGHAPGLDPFTFGSQDRLWVDLHWGFEVVLSWAYDLGGVAGIILLAATVAMAGLLTALAVRRPGAPLALAVICWVPALLLMSSRFNARPEMFTLLYLAAFLAVLSRLDKRPALVWLLPLVQVLWVNTQGLFVLGPILVGFFLAERAVRRWWGKGPSFEYYPKGQWQIPAAFAAVLLACLINPYGLEGALFPVLLYPKVSQAGNPYKEYIAEFASARESVLNTPGGLGPGNPYNRALYFLLLALPLSFLFPAIWNAWNSAPPAATGRQGRKEAAQGPGLGGAWAGAFAAAAAILVVSALSLPVPSTTAWLVVLGDALPAGLLAIGAASAAALRRRSAWVAWFALVAGAFMASWAAWLRDHLGGAADGFPLALWFAVAAGLISTLFYLRSAGSLFRLLAAVAFAFLGLQAVRNAALFGLVAGALLAWNLGEWAVQFTQQLGQGRPMRMGAWGLRLGGASLLGVWIFALLGGDYYGWMRQPRRLGLRERPLEFAHDAVRFAGGPGMPERALVYGLAQTGVFDFHNAPDHKQFIDARLELPDPKTFKTYITIERWLRERNPRWVDALRDLDEPLVLLTHRDGNASAEAALLCHPQWRCVYFDALACVFLPRSRADLQGAYPEVDFARRHFQPELVPVIPDEPGAALAEARALLLLGGALQGPGNSPHSRRFAVLLAALGRAARAVKEAPAEPDAWVALGGCHRRLAQRPGERPIQTQSWDPTLTIQWAQACWCGRRALELDPDHPGALNLLYDAFWERQMADAQLAVGQRLLALGLATTQQQEQIQRLSNFLAQARPPATSNIASDVATLLDSHQPVAAVSRFEQGESLQQKGVDWALAEKVGNVYLSLGLPGNARRIWRKGLAPPSEGLRLCRLAATFWIEHDLDAAITLYGQALAGEPRQAVAWWALSMLHTQQGKASKALQACQAGLRLSVSQSQGTDLRQLEPLLTRFAPAGEPRASP
jgi:tetratricopeptide (TPR) repeat protein